MRYLVAHLSDGEAGAVHLEALALVAVAACVLILFRGVALLLQHATTGRRREPTAVDIFERWFGWGFEFDHWRPHW